MVLYPQQFDPTAICGCFAFLPCDVTLINEANLRWLGTVDLSHDGHARATHVLESVKGWRILDLVFLGTWSGSCNGGLPTDLPQIHFSKVGPRFLRLVSQQTTLSTDKEGLKILTLKTTSYKVLQSLISSVGQQGRGTSWYIPNLCGLFGFLCISGTRTKHSMGCKQSYLWGAQCR